jgi:hypothetical protein
MNKQINVGLAGKVKLVAVNAETGEERLLADWFDNLITDAGLNRMGSGAFGDYCLVGSGSTPPTVSDTALGNYIATHSTYELTVGAATSAPYYGWERFKYRFAQGAAAGNISEVGIGWSATNQNLFARTLVKDSGGSPTTVTVLANEFLDVFHEIRVYAPASDVTSQVTIAGVVHDTIVRPSYVTDGDPGRWRPFRAQAIGIGAYISTNFYSGAIGAQTSGPTGGLGGSSPSVVESAYVQNSLKRTAVISAGLDSSNTAGGIRSLQFGTVGMGSWQVQFTPTIAKDNTKTLSLTVEVSWARRP